MQSDAKEIRFTSLGLAPRMGYTVLSPLYFLFFGSSVSEEKILATL
jgi:hypothetical protein